MKQYLDLAQRIVDQGHWVENERTGKKCLTVINADLTYDVGAGEFPLCTTRKSYWKAAVAEMIGYIRGYDNAEDFRKLGTPTWDANANENPVWLNNPFNKGTDDMGNAYKYRTNGYHLKSPKITGEYPQEQNLPKFDTEPCDFSNNVHGIVGVEMNSNSFGKFIVLNEHHKKNTNTCVFDIQFISTGYIKRDVHKAELLRGEVKDMYHPAVCGVACVGNIVDIDTKLVAMLKPIWNNLIKRCYNDNEQHGWWYGTVFVCDEWLVFENFVNDFIHIPNWELKLVFPEQYSLDKDWCGSNYYSKSTCRWSSKTEQSINSKSTNDLMVHKPNGDVVYFKGSSKFVEQYGLPKNVANKLGECTVGESVSHSGYTIELLEPKTLSYVEVDQFKTVYAKLVLGIDDRGLIIDLHNPHLNESSCLRACMYNHQFSLLGGKLYLNSTQRSMDVPLGGNFNMVQVYILLAIMAQITGLEAGQAFHKIVNAHIYEDQLDLMKNVQLKREPLKLPKLKINPKIKTLEDLETWVTLSDFEVEGYECHEPIKYPFTV